MSLGIFNTLLHWLNRKIHNGPPMEAHHAEIPPTGSLDYFISWLPSVQFFADLLFHADRGS